MSVLRKFTFDIEVVAAGAVVAREYGLPCVVKVSNATVLFSSGQQCYYVA